MNSVNETGRFQSCELFLCWSKTPFEDIELFGVGPTVLNRRHRNLDTKICIVGKKCSDAKSDTSAIFRRLLLQIYFNQIATNGWFATEWVRKGWHRGDRTLGVRLRIALLAPGIRIRQVAHGFRRGILQEVLARKHHPQGHRKQGTFCLKLFLQGQTSFPFPRSVYIYVIYSRLFCVCIKSVLIRAIGFFTDSIIAMCCN